MFEFVKPMSEVGTPIVLSALVVWFFYKLSTYFFIYLDSKIKSATEQKENVGRKHDIKEYVQRDMENREKLIRLRYELDADRVLLFGYHNGIYDMNGIGFLRVSALDEVTSYGTKPMSQFYRNIPIAVSTLWNRAILKRDDFEVVDVEELSHTDAAAYEQMKSAEVQSFYSTGWYDDNGIPRGYIQVSFCKKKHTQFSQQQKDLVEQVMLMIK